MSRSLINLFGLFFSAVHTYHTVAERRAQRKCVEPSNKESNMIRSERKLSAINYWLTTFTTRARSFTHTAIDPNDNAAQRNNKEIILDFTCYNLTCLFHSHCACALLRALPICGCSMCVCASMQIDFIFFILG